MAEHDAAVPFPCLPAPVSCTMPDTLRSHIKVWVSNAGVFIESEDDHTMDLKDMERKIKEHPEAKFMLVSHMRGKLCDMDKVKEMCKEHGITMIEDCAHSVGVFWGEEHTGHHGVAACFSTQSHKAINSGEGGFLCTGDALSLSRRDTASLAFLKMLALPCLPC